MEVCHESKQIPHGSALGHFELFPVGNFEAAYCLEGCFAGAFSLTFATCCAMVGMDTAQAPLLLLLHPLSCKQHLHDPLHVWQVMGELLHHLHPYKCGSCHLASLELGCVHSAPRCCHCHCCHRIMRGRHQAPDWLAMYTMCSTWVLGIDRCGSSVTQMTRVLTVCHHFNLPQNLTADVRYICVSMRTAVYTAAGCNSLKGVCCAEPALGLLFIIVPHRW